MATSNTIKKHRFGSPKKWKLSFKCYAMLLTQIIGFFVFTLYPLLWAAHKAWHYYDGIGANTRFIGWENFIRIFTEDATYWSTWISTFKFALMKMPIELPLALFLAVLLNKKLKGSGFYRTMYFMPCVISVAIIGLIFGNMFDYFG